jgi:biopolymer transport protein ExbB
MLQQITTFLDSGGPVLYGIFAISVLLWGLILDRYWFFRVEAKTLCKKQLERWRETPKTNNWFAKKIRDGILSEVQEEFQHNRDLIQLLVVVCPLMGLLGTVTGMISVFDTMSVTGTGNARAMASGISMATVPTMAGMIVSLIGLYFKTRFEGLADKTLERFQDKLLK